MDTALINRMYYGYQDTSYLGNNYLQGIRPYSLATVDFSQQDWTDFPRKGLVLGKIVEFFVQKQVQKLGNTVLIHNHQIQENKQTIGEIDLLFQDTNHHYIHLEMVYKFYLYDPAAQRTIEAWIGPNRRDTLLEKLQKLSQKQLRIFQQEACKPLLQDLGLTMEQIQSFAHFKAQLFVPYGYVVAQTGITPTAVTGYYGNLQKLETFAQSKFYLPRKWHWLLRPHTQVTWLSLEEIRLVVLEKHKREQAPMLWIKEPNGSILKFFVVWW